MGRITVIKSRLVIIITINLSAVVLLLAFMTFAVYAAPEPNPLESNNSVSQAPAAGTLTMTMLNVNSASGSILIYFDHNETKNEKFFVRGHYVGAKICASGGDMLNVEAEISVPMFDGDPVFFEWTGTNDDLTPPISEYELGWQEAPTRTWAAIPEGECRLAYYYVLPPYDADAPPPPSTPRTSGTFSITVTSGGILYTTEVFTMTSLRTITAAPNEIIQIVKTSQEYFTLTVDFDMGNVGSQGGDFDATFLPTSFVAHDAGMLQLVKTSLTITGTTSYQDEPDVIYAESITTQNLQGSITYLFKRMTGGGQNFYPLQSVSSGNNDKSQLNELGVPTAITLNELSAIVQETYTAIPVGIILILAAATIAVLRKSRRKKVDLEI
jgi:hypothetical protein